VIKPLVVGRANLSVRRGEQSFVKSRSALISLVALSLALLPAGVGFADVAESSGVKGVRDFVEYWGASRLLLTGGNPYSPAELLSIQKAVGWSSAEPLIMWNPPWTLSFILPFGLLDFTSGQFVWLLAQVGCVLISAQALWRVNGINGINGQAAAGGWTPWLLGLTFVPTSFVLILGQITPFILLGLTALLYFERKEHWFAFGAAIAILSIKPHLIYLFWIVLVLWIWQGKRWRVALGAAVAGTCTAVIPLLLDPRVYSEYLALHRIEGVTKPLAWPTPTLGNVVKIFFHFDSDGLQLIPSLVAVVWVLCYWRRHKQGWQWSEQLPLIILVSVTTNFFVWTYDQVVFLPALIQGAGWLVRLRLPWYRSIAALLYIVINLAHVILRFFVAEELWYFWLAPALLIAYLVYRWEAAGKRLTAG
jgi:hypothetical protein